MVCVTWVEISAVTCGVFSPKTYPSRVLLTRDRTTGRRDAHTSTMLGHRAGINHVGSGRAQRLDVRLLCPHGDDLSKPVRSVPERAPYPVARQPRIYAHSIRATPISSYIPFCPGTHAPTESSPRLRLK